MALRRGDSFPSVTEVLELAGLVDLSMIPSSILETAKERGTLVHQWIEWIERGEARRESPSWLWGAAHEAPEEIHGYLDAWQKAKLELEIIVTHSEQNVRNETYNYDGTLDILATVQGRKALIDLKCVYQLHHTTALQTAGYAACVEGGHLLDRYAIQLRRDGTYTPKKYTGRHDRNTFLALVVGAHYQIEHKGELPWIAP